MDWTVFWGIMLILLVFLPLLMIWMFAIVDLFGRADIGGFGKVLWLLAILFLPILGTLMYYLFRPVAASYRWESRSTSGSTGEQSSSG
jgi:membrane protein implicated in regulation of membrane protease activity